MKNRPLIFFWDTETGTFDGEALSSQHIELEDAPAEGQTLADVTAYFTGCDCVEQSFRDMISRKQHPKQRIRVYAHNASFDIQRIKSQMPTAVVKIALVMGSMVAGVMKYEGTTFELRDSARLLPDSLKKLAGSLAPECPKLEAVFGDNYDVHDPENVLYAKQDVIALRQVIINFASKIETPVENLKISAAAQAFALFKAGYEETEGKYYAVSREVNEHILKFYYYGGRIVIRNGHDPFALETAVSLDITSSYPFQMFTQILPIPGKAPKRMAKIPKAPGRYFVHIRVHNYATDLPILPCRHADGGVFYPLGTFETRVSDLELAYLRRHNPKLRFEVFECLFWPIGVCSFWLRPYIEKYYKLKQQGDDLNAAGALSGEGKIGEALRTVAKLFLNSLYGKFAQKYIDKADETGFGDGCGELTVFGASDPRNDHRNAHISAFITASARVQLYDAISYYGAENIIYCDTDSVKIIKSVYDSKPKMKNEGDNLGDWKDEGLYTDLQVIAPKVYSGFHKNKVELKAKGLPIKFIHAVVVEGVTTKTHGSQSDETDKVMVAKIVEAARTTLDIKVLYVAKPLKMKSFINGGGLAYTNNPIKTMSKPTMVKGMDYRDGKYWHITLAA